MTSCNKISSAPTGLEILLRIRSQGFTLGYIHILTTGAFYL